MSTMVVLEDTMILPRCRAPIQRNLVPWKCTCFRGERVMASWASVDTLATFAARGGRKNACWGASPNPASSAQAPYPAPRRKRQGLLIPLRLLSPRKPCLRGGPGMGQNVPKAGCGTGLIEPVPYCGNAAEFNLQSMIEKMTITQNPKPACDDHLFSKKFDLSGKSGAGNDKIPPLSELRPKTIEISGVQRLKS